MVHFSSSHTFESKVFPGVTFALRKMTEARRAQLRLLTAEANVTIRDLMNRLNALREAPEDSRDVQQIITLNEEMQTVIQEQLNPAWIQWGVKNIGGMTLDETPISVDNASEWPSELYTEVVNAVKATANMTDAEIKNFDLPSISGVPMDGKSLNTGAQSASDVDTSAHATAEGSFQN